MRLRFFDGSEGIFATGAALQCAGAIIPGNSVTVSISGWPNASPVTLALGADVQNPALGTQHGNLYLTLPLVNSWPLGTIPASGRMTLPVTVPVTWSTGEQYPFQALIGPWGGNYTRLTNLMLLVVE